MKKFDRAIESYRKSLNKKIQISKIDEDLLQAIARSLGPTIYDKDASLVACSDKKELKRIKEKFLIKKLGLEDGAHLDEAIQETCAQYGSSNPKKYRVVFYYLLISRFNKQSLYLSTDNEESQNTENVDDLGSESIGEEATPDDVIYKHALFAAGAGFIPVPLVDLASISAVQYKMIKSLAAYYPHVEFSEKKAQSLLASMLGGISAWELGLFAKVFMRWIPVVGPIVGGTATSAFAFGSTQIIGQIFNEHFLSGGDLSLEELSIKKMRETFKFEMLRQKMS